MLVIELVILFFGCMICGIYVGHNIGKTGKSNVNIQLPEWVNYTLSIFKGK